MMKLTPVLFLIALATPALAQTAPAAAEKVAYTCWYNAAGKLTSAKPAEGTPAPSHFITTGRDDDQAWAYGIHSVDGHECPARVRL